MYLAIDEKYFYDKLVFLIWTYGNMIEFRVPFAVKFYPHSLEEKTEEREGSWASYSSLKTDHQ